MSNESTRPDRLIPSDAVLATLEAMGSPLTRTLARELREARAVLRDVQWSGWRQDGLPCCPSCGMVEPPMPSGGHDADCALMKAAVVDQLGNPAGSTDAPVPS